MRTTTTLILIFTFSSLSAQPVLVKDIYPGSSPSTNASWIYYTQQVGDTFYFAADDSTHGVELWKTDGTESGTTLVKDINIGTTADGIEALLLGHDGYLFFDARVGNARDLWRSDGTEAGTVPYRDVCGGTYKGPGGGYKKSDLIFKYGKLYFKTGSSDVTLSGDELWVSDGTPAGTAKVKHLGFNSADAPFGLIDMNDQLFFSAGVAFEGRGLWASDGTDTGTVVLKTIVDTGTGGFNPSALRPANDYFYFRAYTPDSGHELWVSDGTEAGTVMLKDIYPGAEDGVYDLYDMNNARFTADGRFLFPAKTAANGTELWISDGTAAGTQMLKDINPGAENSGPVFLGTLGNFILFRAHSGNIGGELWVTDGTAAGTQLLKEIYPGLNNFNNASYPAFIVHQDKMYFSAADGVHGRELWVTDGTADGTKMLHDINPGAAESDPREFHVVGNNLLFFAKTEEHGRELWKYDLTTISTNEPEQEIKVQVYPTASQDGVFTLKIESATSETFCVEVLDVIGRIQAAQNAVTGTQTIQISNLPAGVYLIRVMTSDGRPGAVRRVFIAK
jgi:ELWxxDGT repeat protein